jgi:peptide/nickel transport system substrate-binding protein
MNDIKVRQAVAYGLDRASVVNSFYSGRGQVAREFEPPQLFGWSNKVTQYPYNPTKAKALLNSSSCHVPCKVDVWYPTGVSRPYMPDPKRNFEAFAADLEAAGFHVIAHSAPWIPEYIDAVQRGKAQLYLLGWIADLPDPDNFFGVHFGRINPQFGFRDAGLFALVARAAAEPDPSRRAALYRGVSRLVMSELPLVPYASFSDPLAVSRNLVGYVAAPTGPVNEPLARVSFR